MSGGGAARCRVCLSPDRARAEALGIQALADEISWNSAKEELGLTDLRQLRNHMENHFVQVEESTEQERFDHIVQETINGFYSLMRGSTPEKRTQYLMAIKGLRDMKANKMSHANLATILKSLQEQQQQQSILQFVENMFPGQPVIDVEVIPALESGG